MKKCYDCKFSNPKKNQYSIIGTYCNSMKKPVYNSFAIICKYFKPKEM